MPLRIKRELVDLMVAHAKADLPNECCGLVATRNVNGDSRDRVAVDVFPMETSERTAAFFMMDPWAQIEMFERIHAQGLQVGAMYHSHPGLQPVPSMVDEDYAQGIPGVIWIIVGFPWKYRGRASDITFDLPHEPDEPAVWAWWIENGEVATAELLIDA